MFRTIQIVAWVAGAGCFLLTASASAQLLPATWNEFVRMDSGYSYSEFRGQYTAVPEPLVIGMTYPCTSVDGDLTFGAAGPPFIIAHSEASRPTCYLAGIYRAWTTGGVGFQLRIIEKVTPPFVVEYVPLMISIKGSAVVSPNSWGTAMASINIRTELTQIFSKRVDATDDTGLIDMDATEILSIQPGVVLTGHLSVSTVAVAAPPATCVATASVGPAFEITSDLIPGTELHFEDYFEIEYCSGYWALGDPTPVTPTTWGKIKSLYSDGR